MPELHGISCYKENKYCLFCINEFTDEIKNELQAQFAAICHGEDYAGSGRVMYNYRNSQGGKGAEGYEKRSLKVKPKTGWKKGDRYKCRIYLHLYLFCRPRYSNLCQDMLR